MEPGDPDAEARIQGLDTGIPLHGRASGGAAGENSPGNGSTADPSLRGQVLDIIADVISGTTTPPEVRRRLLWQLMNNPGHPERALLSHILDFEGPWGCEWQLRGFEGVRPDLRIPKMIQECPFRVSRVLSQVLKEAGTDLGPYGLRTGEDIQDNIHDLLAEFRVAKLDAWNRLRFGDFPLLRG
jgi:hypothetical protein